jgi:hypothetical protein
MTHVPPGKDKASLTPVTLRIASLPSRKNDKVTSSSMPLFPQVLLFSLVRTSALVFSLRGSDAEDSTISRRCQGAKEE